MIGFHTSAYVHNFLDCCRELVGCEVDYRRGLVRHEGREIWIRAYPLGIDSDRLRRVAGSDEVAGYEQELLARRRQHLIIRVDRADLSKNVLRGFTAFDQFLTDHPEFLETVTFIAHLQPSRQDVAEYQEYLERIEALVAVVNHRHGTTDWMPIDLRIYENFHDAVARYKHYDLLMVNSLFDGMNLVAKEAPAVNTRDGVLMLSENTGSHEELGEFALSVNPFDIEEQAEAIHQALTMSPEEREQRADGLRRIVEATDPGIWIDHQLADIEAKRQRADRLPDADVGRLRGCRAPRFLRTSGARARIRRFRAAGRAVGGGGATGSGGGTGGGWGWGGGGGAGVGAGSRRSRRRGPPDVRPPAPRTPRPTRTPPAAAAQAGAARRCHHLPLPHCPSRARPPLRVRPNALARHRDATSAAGKPTSGGSGGGSGVRRSEGRATSAATAARTVATARAASGQLTLMPRISRSSPGGEVAPRYSPPPFWPLFITNSSSCSIRKPETSSARRSQRTPSPSSRRPDPSSTRRTGASARWPTRSISGLTPTIASTASRPRARLCSTTSVTR